MAENTTPPPKVNNSSPMHEYREPPPFPSRFAKFKEEEEEKVILDTFRKVGLNIPLLDTVKSIPKYAKFLKNVCTNKRKLTSKEQTSEEEHVSLAIEKKLPPKLKDPGPLNETSIVIQLADRYNAYPDGVIEDVLVHMDYLVFPTDFYVLDMEKSETPLILLGRPFLKIVRAKINTFDGSVSLEFDGKIC
ncbi:hypothetical protein GH714_020048 [Hevea brasiliensis]|uniref:Aspartic peptidase DDI1-type domain-containing protein n=1 Tax=Hevea brasiliensis TaxID=3981 RepID=A0A6A6LCN7_HEVBR|nr:hypothetical protein GH714_020048 [Hevea brasiliensis]